MQILAGTSEQLEQARAEVRVLQRLRHPNLLPLLAADTRELQDDEEAGVTAFYLLFPLYTVRMPPPHVSGNAPAWVVAMTSVDPSWQMHIRPAVSAALEDSV